MPYPKQLFPMNPTTGTVQVDIGTDSDSQAPLLIMGGSSGDESQQEDGNPQTTRKEKKPRRLSYTGSNGKGAENQRQTSQSQYMMKIWSALFYAMASFLITVVNKLVLTTEK